MRRFLARVADRRITLTLFIAFLVLFCVGLVLPQRPHLTPDEYGAWAERWPWLAGYASRAGIDDVYRSTVMRVVFVAFTIQLLVYLGLRFMRVLRDLRKPMAEIDPESLPIQRRTPGGEVGLQELATGLKARRYRVTTSDGGGLTASKNRWSNLAGLVFHVSFVLLLTGAWILQVRHFRGDVIVTEGQAFHGKLEEYKDFEPTGLKRKDMPRVGFTPEKIEPVFSATGSTLDIVARILTGKGAERESREFRVNQPVTAGDAEALLIAFGLAPVISVRDRSTGRTVDTQCVNLNVWAPDLPEDSFLILRPPASVLARFYPDHEMTPEGPVSHSMEMRDPRLKLIITPRAPDLPQVRASLKLGDTVNIGRYELKLEELRLWGRFQITRQPGELLLVGFLLMVAGIAFRFFCVNRIVVVRVCESQTSPVLSIGARCEFFPESLERELESILSDLGEAKETL